jgi:glycosyltransferase involved in cell wall biosynthesis
MITILYVVSHLKKQGPNKQLLLTCQALDKEKFRPVVMTTTAFSKAESYYDDFKESKIEVLEYGWRKIPFILVGKQYLIQFIVGYKVDFVQSYGFQADIVCSRLSNVKTITTVRNTLLTNWKMLKGGLKGYVLGRFHLVCLRRFNHVLSCSKSVQEYMDSLGFRTDLYLNSIQPITDDFSLRSFGDIMTFVTVSSRIPGKNVDFLVDVLGSLKYCELIVLGFCHEELKVEMAKHKNISYVGNVENILDYFTSCDIFISASSHEGMPNAVLEALSVGVPVLLSDISPHNEILGYSNDPIGAAFKLNDRSSFLEKLKLLTSMERKHLSKNARVLIENRFRIEANVRSYEKLLRQYAII